MEEKILETQPAETLPKFVPSPKTGKEKSWLKIVSISLLGLVLVGGLVFAGFKLRQRRVLPLSTPIPTVIPTLTLQPESDFSLEDTADWKTYTNGKFKYRIKYPDDWIVREFPDKTGAGFQPFGLPSEITNEVVSVDIVSRPGLHQDTPFEEYIRVVGLQDIQGFVEINSVKPVSSRYGVEGYVTIWKIEDIGRQRGISNPIAYMEVEPPRYEIIFGQKLKYDVIRLSLLREEYLSTFDFMLSTLEFLPSREAGLKWEYCIKAGTDEKMGLGEAKEIAQNSECVQEGKLKEERFCNENTGTWWIDLDVQKEGCNPACVVDVATKKAEINWRCTGGLIPQ